MFQRAILFAPVCFSLAAWGQDTPPVAPAPAAPPVLENTGKPLVLPFACTNDDITWAGLTCSDEEPCPIYLELAATQSVGNRILAAGNIHSDTVTLYSVLLGSEDAGHTWSEVHERIRAASLDRFQFLDGENGWISGGTLFPLTQDPFFLITGDGGKTWRRRPISSETLFGSIHQFFFDSKSSGGLIIDQGPGGEGGRYMRYESPDGGETWTIKEESGKLLQLKTAPPALPAAILRVRADAATHAFEVERRQGDRWTPVAAFSVKLPACTPTQ